MRVTIDNAHQITLQRTFNYHSIAFKPFQTVLKIIRKLQNKRDIYTLREIYDEFNKSPSIRPLVKYLAKQLGEEKGNSIFLMIF